VALYDATPDPGLAFGHTVALPFGGISSDTDLLSTGTSERLFVYFRTLAAGTDPRP
jgi:hypothetical protein